MIKLALLWAAIWLGLAQTVVFGALMAFDDAKVRLNLNLHFMETWAVLTGISLVVTALVLVIGFDKRKS